MPLLFSLHRGHERESIGIRCCHNPWNKLHDNPKAPCTQQFLTLCGFCEFGCKLAPFNQANSHSVCPMWFPSGKCVNKWNVQFFHGRRWFHAEFMWLLAWNTHIALHQNYDNCRLSKHSESYSVQTAGESHIDQYICSKKLLYILLYNTTVPTVYV